jgi:uncharacterized protein DUF6065
MNETPNSYAYRCLPLSIANAHGWEVRCPVAFEAEWNGGSGTNGIHIAFDEGENTHIGSKKISTLVESHFGSGILTFIVGVVLETPPGYDLWVSGPVNEFKDGIQALSAVVESYWMPFTFTMNWKFTRPNWRVRFEKEETFCFFFPIEHGLVERFDPSFAQLDELPDLERQYNLAFYKRTLPMTLKRLRGEEFEIKERDRFEGWYIKGELPDGTEISDHKRRLQVKPFDMGRNSPRR